MINEKIKNIADHLIHLEKRCKILNESGLTDESKLFELQIIPIFNLVFNLSLKNTNSITSNFPYIDAFDETTYVGLQITTNTSAKKISETLDKIENSSMQLSKLYFFVLTEKKYSKDFVESEYFSNSNIIRIKDLINKIESEELVGKVYEILNKTYEMLCKNTLYIKFVKTEKKYFFPTRNYENALEKLYKYNKVLITGNPGVGKSAISYKLLEDAVTLGYITIFSVDDWKSDQKQILLFDDFIHSNDYRNANIEEVKKKLAYLDIADKNTLVILNSRTHLISELKKQNMSCYLNEHKPYKVEMNYLNEVEKIKILRNYFLVNFSKQDLLGLFGKNNYGILSIIRHKNFNLRLISAFSQSGKQEKNISIHESVCQIMNKIDTIYDEPYNIFSDTSKRILKLIYLFQISNMFEYGKTDTEIIFSMMKKYFNTESEEVEYAIKSIMDAFIFTNDVYDGEKQYLSFINPGVADFIKKKIDNDSSLVSIFEEANTEELVLQFNDNKYIQGMKINKIIQINKVISTKTLISTAKSTGNKELIEIANKRILQDGRMDFYYDEVDVLLPENIPEYIKKVGVASIGSISSLNEKIVIELIRSKEYFKISEIIGEFVEQFYEYWENEMEENTHKYDNFDDFSNNYKIPEFESIFVDILSNILYSMDYEYSYEVASDIVANKKFEEIVYSWYIEEGIEDLKYIYILFSQIYSEINELEFNLEDYEDYEFDNEIEVEESERDKAIRKFREEVLKKED